MQIKVLWPFIMLLFCSLPLPGQSWRAKPYEFYGGIVTASYFGDIGGTADNDNLYGLKDLDILRTRPGAGAGLRYFQNDYLAFNGSLSLGWLSGNDEGGRNESRAYIFNSVILETAARIEFFPVKDIRVLSGVNRRGLVRNYGTFSVYIFGGAGALVYHVIPNENLKERRERDNIDHGMVTMVLPAGAGIKIGISNRMDIGLEIGGRYSLNDYLDGFTSPTATSNDIYYLTNLQLVYRMNNLKIK